MEKETQIFGLCWFQPEQWDRLVEISEDRADLDDSYEEWRKNASSAIREIESTGNKVNKVKINLEDLLVWCNDKGVAVNGQSRAEYATHTLHQKNDQP